MEVARVIARRSRCSRARCGAVIVSPNQRVVATGYNGPPRNWTGQFVNVEGTKIPENASCLTFCERALYGPQPQTLTSYEDCPSIHAEMNALMHSSRIEREGGTIYISGVICFNCTKAIANSGIKRVVVGIEPDPHTYRDPDRSVQFLETSGIEVEYLG